MTRVRPTTRKAINKACKRIASRCTAVPPQQHHTWQRQIEGGLYCTLGWACCSSRLFLSCYTDKMLMIRQR